MHFYNKRNSGAKNLRKVHCVEFTCGRQMGENYEVIVIINVVWLIFGFYCRITSFIMWSNFWFNLVMGNVAMCNCAFSDETNRSSSPGARAIPEIEYHNETVNAVEWKCKECTYTNPNEKGGYKIDRCGQTRCHLAHLSHVTRCQMCGSQKIAFVAPTIMGNVVYIPAGALAAPQPQSRQQNTHLTEWNCPYCTYTNQWGTRCELCNAAKVKAHLRVLF